MSSEFSILLQREIYDILIGDVELLSGMAPLSMPYYSGSALVSLCAKFGHPAIVGSSRWTYIEELLKHVIQNGRINNLLQYLFKYENFRNVVSDSSSIEEMKSKYNYLVAMAIEKINECLLFDEKKLVMYENTFALVSIDVLAIIESVQIQVIDLAYIHNLKKRIEQDLGEGRFDNVLSTARTLVEEVIIYILEKKQYSKEEIPTKGDLGKLQQLIKNELGIQQSKSFDNRINAMLSGLEKTIQSVNEMRNAQGASHGQGSKRIKIRKHEAQLVVNATITYLDYIFSVYLEQNGQ